MITMEQYGFVNLQQVVSVARGNLIKITNPFTWQTVAAGLSNGQNDDAVRRNRDAMKNFLLGTKLLTRIETAKRNVDSSTKQ